MQTVRAGARADGPKLERQHVSRYRTSTGSMDRDLGPLRELLGTLLTASLRSRRLQTSMFQNSYDLSAEKRTFAQISQDVSAEYLTSEVRN